MSFSIPTWLKQDDDLMLGDRPGSSDWFALSDEVGRGRTNHRRDVIKVESLLNQAGLFDLERLDGPWGYANERLDAPIKEYQKRNGLKVDGFMRPDGETINRFRQDFGDTFANFPAPTPAMADAHHALREQGEDGLLVDRWPELKINSHPRLDPLTAGTRLDEWNDSWVRHAIRANGSFEGIPAELRKNIDVDAVRGMIQARDMTRRWEAQRPGEGNQFARAMLHALGDKPDYQSAYLASEIPQGPPIGTLRPDAAQRYAAMVEEGRAAAGEEAVAEPLSRDTAAAAESVSETQQAFVTDPDEPDECREISRKMQTLGQEYIAHNNELAELKGRKEHLDDVIRRNGQIEIDPVDPSRPFQTNPENYEHRPRGPGRRSMISPIDGEVSLAAFRGGSTPRIPMPPAPPPPPREPPRLPKPTQKDIAKEALEGAADAVPKIIDGEMKQAEAKSKIAKATEELKEIERKIHRHNESVGAIKILIDRYEAERTRLGCEDRAREERGRRSQQGS